MHISVLSVPMDLGADRRGVDMGPSAIRYAGLTTKLRDLGHTVALLPSLHVPDAETLDHGDPRLKYLDPIVEVSSQLAEQVQQVLRAGSLPLVLGGDHSIALGSVAGVAAARGPIGLLWMDAHGDYNTAETTPSGNIHGMILAALSGRGDARLTHVGGSPPHIEPRHVAIVGARSLDDAEKLELRAAGVRVYPMPEIDKRGMASVMEEAIGLVTTGTNGMHISFDMDVVEPTEAPGVGTPVHGGITYREAHLAMEMFAASDQLVALDVVEVNPILDQGNRTAILAAELILSALGKTIC